MHQQESFACIDPSAAGTPFATIAPAQEKQENPRITCSSVRPGPAAEPSGSRSTVVVMLLRCKGAGGRSRDCGHVPVLAARIDRRARRLARPAQGLEGLPQQQEAHEEQHGREAPRGAALRAVALCVLVPILCQGNSCVRALICGHVKRMGLPHQPKVNGALLRGTRLRGHASCCPSCPASEQTSK